MLLIRHYRDRAIDELLAACSHSNPTVRLRAGWILAHTQDPRALPALLALTEDGDDDVRYDCTVALGILGGPEALRHVVRLWMLEDESRPAAMALCRWGEEALEAVALGLGHASAGIRLDALYVLGHIATPKALAMIESRLDDSDSEVREEAKYWMESHGAVAR